MLHSIGVLADIFGSVNPYFFTLSFLNIINPLSFIATPIYMRINSKSICLVRHEITDINITFSMPKCSFAFCFIIIPMAFIYSTINPFLYSITLPYLSTIVISFLRNKNLSFIHTSIWKHIIINEYQSWVLYQSVNQVFISLFKCVLLVYVSSIILAIVVIYSTSLSINLITISLKRFDMSIFITHAGSN